jgi:AraC family transcriptional regulator
VNYLAQIQRGIDYIEAHLESEVEAGDVARHAGISHWHFQRIFKALTNETLKTYIRSRRLASSLDKLAASNERILEIALAAGFESQQAFTRAFKKAFGVTPASYRRHHGRFPFLRKVRFDADYLRHLHHNLSLEPEIYDQRAMLLVGLSTRFYSVDSEKNNLGDKLPALWQAFLARLEEVPHAVPGICYGVVRQTPAQTDELEYYAAIEVEEITALPAGLESLCLPAARYARFAHRGSVAHVDRTVNYIYSSWLARAGMRHTYAADLESYDARYHPTSDDSLLHYAIPVDDDLAASSDEVSVIRRC